MNENQNRSADQAPLPPGQQLVAKHKWPIIGERQPVDCHDSWTLSVTGLNGETSSWSLVELGRLPRTEITTDIHCVTRWSKLDMTFGGVLLGDLLEACRLTDSAQFISFVANTDRRHSTSLVLSEAIELQTLLALEYAGSPLPVDHGGPLRVIVPGKYFYKSLKWLAKIELLAEDRLGNWESQAGYHNAADPWREQRYMAATISKQTAAKLIASGDFGGRDLRSLDASHRKLNGLLADQASLRDANFSKSSLRGASFRGANLSNAHFAEADLQGANFQQADLEGADFSGADLRDADLSGASLFGASFVSPKTQVGAVFNERTVLPWPQCLAELPPDQARYVESFFG